MRKRAGFAPFLRRLATALQPMALAADVAMSSLCRPGRARAAGSARFGGGGVIRGCCFDGSLNLKSGGREAPRVVAARTGGLDVRLRENSGAMPMTRDAVGELGKPPDFSLHDDKLVVAVDVDEGMAHLLTSFLFFCLIF